MLFIYTMKPSPYAVERKVFGFALSYNPAEIFQAIREKTNNSSPQVVAGAVAEIIERDMILQSRVDDSSLEIVSDALEYVSAGIGDTYKILKNEFAANPGLTFEQSIDIAQHPQTIRTIAALALRSEDMLGPMINRHPSPSTYQLDASQQYLQPGDQLRTSTRFGCPFAGHEGIVEPDPLFIRFTGWAGAISVQHYYDQPLK